MSKAHTRKLRETRKDRREIRVCNDALSNYANFVPWPIDDYQTMVTSYLNRLPITCVYQRGPLRVYRQIASQPKQG